MSSHQQFGLQKLSAFLNAFQKDSPTLKSIQLQSSLLDSWRHSVDEPLKNHCMPLSYEKGILSVQLQSQGWAQKLRFEQASIENRLRKCSAFRNLKSIRIRVQPSPAPLPVKQRAKAKTARKPITRETANLLTQVADTIHDEKLAASLRRIAGRVTDRS